MYIIQILISKIFYSSRSIRKRMGGIWRKVNIVVNNGPYPYTYSPCWVTEKWKTKEKYWVSDIECYGIENDERAKSIPHLGKSYFESSDIPVVRDKKIKEILT